MLSEQCRTPHISLLMLDCYQCGVRASMRVQRPRPPAVRRSGVRLLQLTCTKLDIAQHRKCVWSIPEATMRRVQEYEQNAKACRKNSGGR